MILLTNVLTVEFFEDLIYSMKACQVVQDSVCNKAKSILRPVYDNSLSLDTTGENGCHI